MVAVHKKNRTCKIIDFAVPGDSRIEEKMKEKVQKGLDLQSKGPRPAGVHDRGTLVVIM